MTTLTHCTSTIAWRITTCTEPARIVSQSLIITLTFLGSSRVLHLSPHLHVIHVCGGCLSLIRRSPLSTSSSSSCPFWAAQEVGVNRLTHPLRWRESGRLVDSAPTQVMSPTSPTPPAVRIQSTRRSTFPTGTKICWCSDDVTHDVHQCRRHDRIPKH